MDKRFGLKIKFSRAFSPAAWAALFFFFAAICLPLTALAADGEAGFFSKLDGKVDIQRAGSVAPAAVKTGDKVFIGDIIRTKAGSKAELTFKDNTIVKLAPETRIKVDEYLFNADGGRKKGSLYLFRGKVRGVVSNFKKNVIPVSMGESTFDIKTPTAIAGVRGTDLFVFYLKGSTGVVFRDGYGFVYNPNAPDKVVDMRAGQATFVTDPASPPLPPKRALNIEFIRHTADTEIDGNKSEDGSVGYEGTESSPLEITASGDSDEGESSEGDDNGNGSIARYASAVSDDFGGEAVYEDSPEIPVSESNPDLLGEAGSPRLTILSAPARANSSSSASFSISSNEPASLTYSLDNSAATGFSDSAELPFYGLSEGTHTLTVTATDSEGNVSITSYSWFYGTRGYTLDGIADSGVASGALALNTSRSAGGWYLDLSGSLDNSAPDAAWKLYSGGTGYDSTGASDGIWLLKTDGTSSDGELSGTSNFTYLSTTYLGTGTGTFSGSYDLGSNRWDGTAYDSGTYTETPLTFASSISGEDVTGLLGGTSSIWSSTGSNPAAFKLIADYSSETSDVWATGGFYSYNFNDDSYTAYDGGAYYAFAGGDEYNSALEGGLYGIYIDPSGNAGIIKGSLSGESYSSIDGLEMDGTLFPIQVAADADVSQSASGLYQSIKTYTAASISSATISGTLGSGTISALPGAWLYTSSLLDGQNWGVWYSFGQGSYSGSTSDTWSLSYYDDGYDDGMLIAGNETTGSTWSSNTLSGSTLGYGASYKSGTTWITAGKTFGTYDPSTYAWEAIQMGAWIDTDKYIAMTQTSTGQAALQSLNIPYVEVGRATLSGTDGNLSVTMTDTAFFAFSSGASAKLWATDSVSGTYASTPSTGTAVSVTGGGISGTFTVQQWSSGNWLSAVSGSGTYSGTGTMNGSSVQMTGAAAGTYSSGAFSGTGAGTAR
ncbi:MAG: FecR domain-containing protein [Deltaproteobacteria bacterium]|nr:FecR domain-containing protein [Deltaproteobacteria bacterium]